MCQDSRTDPIRSPNQPFHPQYWAGIDCSGLVQRCGEAAVNSFSDSIVETLSLGRNSCQFFYDDFTCYMHKKECVPLAITDWPSGFSHLFSAVDSAKRGDLVSYQYHISIIYSDPKADGNYEIVHANGSRCTKYDRRTGGCESEKFARKVLVTDHTFERFPDPVGFGRIKLWN